MKGWIKWAALAGTLLTVAVGQDCSSTAPGANCVKCSCQCQNASGTATTTFERRDASGVAQELDCTVKGDCVEECSRAGVPGPTSATCLAVQ
jgi:hypothetical protein